MQWSNNDKISHTNLNRLAASVAPSFTIYKSGSTYYAEANLSGLSDTNNAAFQTVLSACATDLGSTGGRIHLHTGTYSLATSQAFSTGPILLTGEGDGTIIQNSGAVTGTMIRFTGNYPCGIANLQLDNNDVGTTTICVSFEAGSGFAKNIYALDAKGTAILGLVDSTNFDLLRIEGCRVANPGYSTTNVGPGIRVDAAGGASEAIDHVILRDNWVVNGEEHGIKVYSGSCDYCLIEGNYIYDCNTQGIDIQEDRVLCIGNWVDTTAAGDGIISGNVNNRIIGNYVANTTEYGILANSSAHDNVIQGNNIYNATLSNIASAGLRNIVRGNECDTAGGNGIIAEGNYTQVVGNVTQSSTTRGVYVSNATNVLIQGNTIHDTTGIGEYGTSDNTVIKDNIFSGTTFYFGKDGSGAFQLGSLIQDNQGFNPLGKVANAFHSTGDTISMGQGDQATPDASTDYTIKNGDIVISSTDSGNTDCGIQIDDPNGNAILAAAASTITLMTIPVGYIINWGAYTGAAPTVVVCYE